MKKHKSKKSSVTTGDLLWEPRNHVSAIKIARELRISGIPI